MGREILISVDEYEKRAVVLDNGRIDNFFLERQGEHRLIHNVYKGIIEDITPALGAVFVNIGLKKKGFLYSDEPAQGLLLKERKALKGKTIGESAKRGVNALVQVSKEPFGSKGARLSTNISLPGRYLVLMPFSGTRGISKKVADYQERQRLYGIINNIKCQYGIIARTAAVGKEKKEIEKDAQFLIKQWRRIQQKAAKAQSPSLIYEDYDVILRVVRDYFNDSVDRLVIDNKKEGARVRAFVRAFFPHLVKRIEVYSGDVPLYDLRGVDVQIDEIYNPLVKLPSGGYLIIERTEALTVIDVNSGRFKATSRQQEEMALIVNCEAAQEIGRQLRLRDIGGIIVIDFIDMKQQGHKNEVLSVLKAALSSDKAKTDIVTISPLGLVEMTRQRVGQATEEKAYVVCKNCGGRGKIKSPHTTVVELMRKAKAMLRRDRRRKKELVIKAGAEVIDFLGSHREFVSALKKQYKTELSLVKARDIEGNRFELEVKSNAKR